MTDKKDETGKGLRPGETAAAKRPYATIDLKATELGSNDTQKDAPKDAAAAPGPTAATAGVKPEIKPPAGSSKPADQEGATKPGGAPSAAAGTVAAAQAALRRASQSNNFLSHVAAGVAGAVLTLLATSLFGLFSGEPEGRQPGPDTSQRLASLEQAVRQRAAPTGDLTSKLSATEARVAALEGKTVGLSAISGAQDKLYSDVKGLEARVGGYQDLADRLARLDSAMAALSAGDPSARSPQVAALAAKFAEIDKAAADAKELARSSASRAHREFAVLNTETSRLGQRIDTLRGEIEERFKGAAKTAEVAPLGDKIATVEQDLRAFLGSEAERNANTSRVVLALELANLKRAMDRGERYAAELAAVKRVAGDKFDLAPLEHTMHEGVPTVPELAKEFRKVGNAALDAESQPAEAGVIDRLLSSARSAVRVRKAGHNTEDTSAEAIVGRMESALKDGRLAEVLAQGKKLPPKAALVAEDWLRKVEARHTADAALADVETALKTSLGTGRAPGPEPKR